MNVKAALAACQALGIGILTAAVLFFVHRTLSSDGAWPRVPTFGFGDSAEHSVDAAETRSADGDIEQEGEVTGGRRDVDAPSAAARMGADGDGVAADGTERGPTAGRTNPHIEALTHPSPTYRNSSLAAAIRDEGYVCTDVLSSAAGGDDLRSWRVSCEGGRAYLVFADGDELRVEPMHYFDAPTPFIPVEPTESPPILRPPE